MSEYEVMIVLHSELAHETSVVSLTILSIAIYTSREVVFIVHRGFISTGICPTFESLIWFNLARYFCCDHTLNTSSQ